MRIAFAGTPEPAVVTLEALLGSQHDVAFVITRPDAPTGRGKLLTPSAVAQFAQQHGIECLKPTSLKDIEDRLTDIDAVVVVAYGALVPAQLLQVVKHGWINVHYSLLPLLRGAAPVQWAIKNGDTTTGVSAFRIDQGLDTGPVFAQVHTDIGAQENSTQLLDRLTVMGSKLILQVLGDIDTGKATPVAQDPTQVTLAPKITSADARIDWTQSAQQVVNHVRAMAQKPGAWTMSGDERIKIPRAQVCPDSHDLSPGEVSVISRIVCVGASDGCVELIDVQRPGGTSAHAYSWAKTLTGSVILV